MKIEFITERGNGHVGNIFNASPKGHAPGVFRVVEHIGKMDFLPGGKGLVKVLIERLDGMQYPALKREIEAIRS